MEDERGRKRLAIIILLLLLIAAAAVVWLSQGEDEQKWRVTVEVEGNGTAEPMEAVVEDGGSLTIVLTPAEGWFLSEVYLDGELTDFAGREFTISDIREDHRVRAVFSELVPVPTFTLTVFSNSGGSTEPYGTTSYTAGTVVPLTIAPDAGYRISDVRLDGKSVGTPSRMDIAMDADRTVEVVFAADTVAPMTYTVTVSSTSGGSISPSGTIAVEEGGSIVFAITAKSGYRLSSLLVDGRSVGSGLASYTLEDIRKDTAVKAVFSSTSPSPGPTPTVPTLTGITIAHAPDRTSYIEGERFDPSGMVVTARYSDGSSAPVTGYTWTPSGELKTTDTKVTVHYNGKTCIQSIAVSQYMTLEVTSLPDTRVYDIGQELDTEGLVVTARYHDGTSRDVTGMCVLVYDTGSEGTRDVLVTYTEGSHTASTSFEVYVVSSEGFSAIVVSDNGAQMSTPLTGYVFEGPMAPGDIRTLKIEVRNNTSIAASPYLVLDHISGQDDLCSAVSVSCNGKEFTVLDMKGGASVELEDIASCGRSTITVAISMDPAAGNGLMSKSLSFNLSIFADGNPPERFQSN